MIEINHLPDSLRTTKEFVEKVFRREGNFSPPVLVVFEKEKEGLTANFTVMDIPMSQPGKDVVREEILKAIRSGAKEIAFVATAKILRPEPQETEFAVKLASAGNLASHPKAVRHITVTYATANDEVMMVAEIKKGSRIDYLGPWELLPQKGEGLESCGRFTNLFKAADEENPMRN